MKTTTPSYQRHRFPSEIISHAVWLYHRFCLSFREVEELLAERGVTVTYETIRQWCQKFGPDYARKLKKRQGRLGDTWYIDEVFITIQGAQHYLWRAVDQDGDTIDILVQGRRNKQTAIRFFRRLFKGQGREPRWLVTDKLRSYDATHRTIMPTVSHINHPQRFLTLQGLTQNLFRLGRRPMRAVNYRLLRAQVFQVWQDIVCA